MISKNEYAQRRQQVLSAIGEDSIAIIPAAKEYLRNGDAHYQYRQNSDFYYLTGFNEPEAVLVLIPGHNEGEYILFNRPRDPAMEIWIGSRAGQEGARKEFGADVTFPIEQLDELLPKLLQNRTKVYYPIGRNKEFTMQLMDWISHLQAKIRSGINAPSEFHNIEKILHEMRLRKSPAELEVMRKAVAITVEAHERAMKKVKPGIMEYELQAEVEATFLQHGSRSVAYSSIVGAECNSCVLHYIDNNAQIKNDSLVLIDAGAEYENYAADITRTFPANGRFTPEQRAVYEVVLAAQLAVIAEVKPGKTWHDLQKTSERELTKGLIQIGLLKGDLETLLAQGAFKTFYMHRVSHWLGLDVHDVGAYSVKGQWRTLEPGMVLTVEPGIYIAERAGVDKKWWNIGIRIEDDVLVTASGHEVLSAALPKSVDEIEKLVSNK